MTGMVVRLGYIPRPQAIAEICRRHEAVPALYRVEVQRLDPGLDRDPSLSDRLFGGMLLG